MADRTGIEWTDATWNPVRGCSRVSAGCQNCYAERVAARFCGPGQPYDLLIHPKTRGWNGTVKLVPEALQIPWRWTRPRRIFVNSMSDLFHPEVPFEFIAAVFWVMSVTSRHTYQVLTKRPERALAFFEWLLEQHDEAMCWEPGETALMYPPGHEERGARMRDGVEYAANKVPEVSALDWTPANGRRGGYDNCGPGWPYSNVWLGVSVEDQATADERIPLLLQCPAAVRWISAEPLLGPMDLKRHLFGHCPEHDFPGGFCLQRHHAGVQHLGWVVAGGESGPGARPMSPDWARSLRDQCAAAGVPFLFKQWGEWLPMLGQAEGVPARDKAETPDGWVMGRVGKKSAGRRLDGALHDAYPEVSP